MIILETERLIVRHFHVFDVEALQPIFGDAEVMRFGYGVQTTEWIQNWLQKCLENYYQKWGFGAWAVVEKATRQTIGYCGLFYFLEIAMQPDVEIGYRLARTVWGKGYATEAALAVRDYAFNVLTLPRLLAFIDPGNTASIRVAQKLGMTYWKDVMFEGYSHPDHVYTVGNRRS
jgi:[ribosomal protein S5]-alanine N-acetyltransferase